MADGLTVDRVRFDAVLLENACLAGATVLPARARRPARTVGGWRVPCNEGVVDSAGIWWTRAGGNGCSAGAGSGPPRGRSAVHARWSSRWPAAGPQTRIAALAEGWLWCAVLPGGDIRVMAFVDPDRLAQDQAGARITLFRRLLLRAPEIADAPGPAARGLLRCRYATRPATDSTRSPTSTTIPRR